MPYDLYGTYYARRIDAENAEMAQCAAIDLDIAKQEMKEQYERQQLEEYALENVVRIVAVQPVLERNGIDQVLVTVHQRAPRLLASFETLAHQAFFTPVWGRGRQRHIIRQACCHC